MRRAHTTDEFPFPDSDILATRLLTEDGVVEVHDFVPALRAHDPDHRQRLGRRARPRGRRRHRRGGMSRGDTVLFVLEVLGEDQPLSSCGVDTDELFRSTTRFWREWLATSSYKGRRREMVNRSALTLKLPTSPAGRTSRR